MIRILGLRILVIGNSGSGKTTLALELARRIGAPSTDLDRIHWQDGVGNKRQDNLAADMVLEVARESRWVIEGAYGSLAATALPFASSLIWLDLPWTVCSEGLSRRGRWDGATDGEHEAFLHWAEAYWQRQSPTSFAGHLALFENFARPKRRLKSRTEIDALLAIGAESTPL
jgi:adenylate kinase family enzyme